jgi:hypothetical protein
MNPDRDMANSIPGPYFAIKREIEERQELTVSANHAI